MPKFLVTIDSTVRTTLEVEATNMTVATNLASAEVNRIRQQPEYALGVLSKIQRTREVFFSEVKVTKTDG